MGGISKINGRGLDRRSLLVGVAATAGAVSAGLATRAAAAAATAPTATTASGQVRGYNDGPIKVFKGVPYGAPTGGAARWKPASAPAKWTGVRDTIMPGQMCPQNLGAPMAEETAMLQTGPIGEDCLNLNVSTPAVGANSGKRPVIVWYHGGGYAAGSANATSYDARNLCEKHDVVVVAVTHRLNVFGFLYLADLFGPDYADSGNVGIMDCVAALKWVRDNIANFGGDPANVTIAGQSGGGGKVSTLMAIPDAKGLFHRAVAESGANLRSPTTQTAAANAKKFVDALGVKTIAELQAVPADKLVATMNQARTPASPVNDGRTLTHDPFSPGAPPESRDVPMLLGTTETEMVFFPTTPLDPIDDAKFRELVKTSTRASDADVDKLIAVFRHAYPGKDNTYLFQLLASQTSFQEGTVAEAERKAAQGGAPAYLYYFTKHTPVRGGKLRAPHTLEIPYVFDSLAHSQPIIGPVTPEQQALADKVSSTWVAFARTGNPNNPKVPHWAPYDLQNRPVMVINDAWKLENDPLKETREAIADLRTRTPGGMFG